MSPPAYRLEHLRAWLAQSGMNQIELAEAAGLGRAHVSMIVSLSRGVSVLTATKIAKALGIPLGDLMQAPGDTELVSLAGLTREERRIVGSFIDSLKRAKAR